MEVLDSRLQTVRHLTAPTAIHQHKRRMIVLSWIVVALICTTILVEVGLEKTQWWGLGHDDDDEDEADAKH